MRRVRAGWMAAPMAVGVALFSALPILLIAWALVHDWDLLGAPEFVGTAGLTESITESRFVNAVWVALVLVVLVVPAQLVLSVALALVLEQARGASVFRPLLIVPWVVSPIVVGLMWRWVTSPIDGALSALSGRQVDPLSSPTGALFVIALVLIWNNVGYQSLFFSAALTSLPPEYRDMAALDGARGWNGFRFVLGPLLSPTIAFVVLTSLAATTSVFDQIYGLTGGGPGTATESIGVRLFLDGFVLFDLRQAAVGAVVSIALAAPLLLALRTRMTAAT